MSEINNSQISKAILARYIMTVYTDGSVSAERIPLEKGTDENAQNRAQSRGSGISSKILQMTEAIRCMKSIYDKEFSGIESDIIISEVYKNGVVEAAKKFEVTPNSVADKLTRKSKLDKSKWLPMLKKFLAKGDISEVANTLINNARGCELEYVENFIAEMQQK